jgi:hypothetical protein
MTTQTVFALAGIAGVLAAWYALVLGYMLVHRSRVLPPGPATMDLGAEPPAVVNLLVNQGDLTADAADATLLDLAARRVFELFQPGQDPAASMVRVRTAPPADLTPYERRVYDRVAAVAGDRLTPMAKITAGYAEGGPNWFAQLRAEVVADAQARGLVHPRRLGTSMVFGSIVAGMSLSCLGVIPFQRTDSSGLANAIGIASVLGWFCAAPVIGLALLLIASVQMRQTRLTPAGQGAASRWLGVAAWLAAHPALADLPPAAVAVWDRYLAYEVALGSSRVASAALDLRVGRTSWFISRYTGAVRTVRVRYPWSPFSYTQAGVRLVWSLAVLAVWAAAAVLLRGAPLPVRIPVLAVAAVIIVRELYKVVRSIGAKAIPLAVTGQVLAAHPWRPPRNGGVRWYQVVVDNGRDRRTRPWLVRADRLDDSRPGDVVTLRAQRWTRYVLRLHVDRRRRENRPIEAVGLG